MKNALLKDSFREIRKTKSKFFSIFVIVALGVAFFAGIKATCPDMKITADKYFDEYRLMDMRLVSTVGFNDEDVDVIKAVSGAEGVSPVCSMDALVNTRDGDKVLKVFPLPMDKIENPNENYINRTKLVKGRYPRNSGECVAEKGKMLNSELSIGSKIKLSSGTDEDIDESLKKDEYTIVGMVETPYYITTERGTTNIGNGKIDSFIMIPEENFKIHTYTDIFLTFKDAREAFCFDDEYDNILEPIRKELDSIGKVRSKKRYDEIKVEANEKLDEGKQELVDAEKRVDKELADAHKELLDGEKEILDGERELQDKERKFRHTVKEAEEKISNGKRELEKGEREYNINFQFFTQTKKEAEKKIFEGEKKIEQGQKKIDENEVKLNGIKNTLDTNQNLPEEQRVELEKNYIEGQEQLNYMKRKLADSKVELEGKKKELSIGENKLIRARNDLDISKRQLANEEKKLIDSKEKAKDEFTKAHKELDDSREKLESGKKDYEDAKQEADKKIAKAHKKIADGEEKIRAIKDPNWYVIKRNQTLDFIDYEMAADRIDAIAKVFPVFFFFIAALVCFTTMTRMVDEQRIYIGTLKALGYSKLAIVSKYILYAGIASVSGSLIGVLVGFKVFPTIIFNSYRIMYIMPPIEAVFNTFYAIISIAFAVLTTTLAAWISCYKELAETPALLMRPKVQKSGKRIFLEKIKFIWSRFNFTQKVTARNLFRYKKRLFMTILGVGGCTALMVAGFGLRDSIVATATKQFDELYQYDMSIEFDAEDSREIVDIVEKDDRISDYIFIKEQNVDISLGSSEKNAFLIVPEDAKRMTDFILLQSRTTGEKVPFTNKGVVITEKLASLLRVTIGDDIYIKDGDDKKIAVKIAGITENYVSHYVYMAPTVFEKLYGEKVQYGKLVAKTVNTSKDFENRLSTELLKNPEVTSVNFITGISSSYEDMIGSLNYVIFVLIISAGALAFVVLYNLTNVNISERIREIATIKVLGFYDNEVSNYVYKENTVLTMIGMILGLVMGIFLHRYIILTGEIDYIMFGRDIKLMSYVYSAILTIVFATSVDFVMYFRLKEIEMVESLKSVE